MVLRLLGKPPVEIVLFVTGKLSMYAVWLVFLFRLFQFIIGVFEVPPVRLFTATVLFLFGVLIIALSVVDMGASLRLGLPKKETALVTDGLYRYSRNPMYVGFYLLAIAAVIFTFDLRVLIFSLYALFVHHTIVISEERFLRDRFGKKYLSYAKRVRRYF